jgi:hypothetical protein
MKKASLILLLVVTGTGLIIFLRPSQNPATGPEKFDAPSSRNSDISAFNRSVPDESRSFLNTPIMNAVRSALATRDEQAFSLAYESLIEYIKAHPEQIDDYMEALRTEQNEQVLRSLARAIAASEVLWGDKLIETAIELAKDSSFLQRQHMMLHLMANSPEMRDDAFQAVLEIAQRDPDPQVKTSAVVAMAEWMHKFPDQTDGLLSHMESILKTAVDEDVRLFTYQLLALHKEKLPPEMQSTLVTHLKSAADSFSGTLISMALFSAPQHIRNDAAAHVETLYRKASDIEMQRNYLFQLVCLAQNDCVPLLQKTSVSGCLLGEDAQQYLAMLSTGSVNPEDILMQKAVRDAQRNPSTEGCVGHDH